MSVYPYERTTYGPMYERPDPRFAELKPSSDTSWRDQAECTGADTELFYRQDDELTDRSKTLKIRERAAKAYCNDCPVKAECLQDAIETEEMYGIRGGLNPKERWELTDSMPSRHHQRSKR